MYVDASAMVAILLGEDEREALVARLGGADGRVTSVVSAFEAVAALAGRLADPSAAVGVVRELLDLSEIRIADAGGDLLEGLAEAHLRFGEGSGHPAQLDIGDCFSYAMAKATGAPILHQRGDFAHTDLR